MHADAILAESRETLDRLTVALLEAETLDAAQIRALVLGPAATPA